MEAKTTKPNIRKMFIPDDNYVMFEGDLKQADAQVVACEAEDYKLLDLFMDPKIDVHRENAKVGFPGKEITYEIRQDSKRLVHGTNYLGGVNKLAKTLNMTRRQVENFQYLWFQAHPGIRTWHRNIEHELMTTRSVTNIFGYRKYFFGRLERELPEAIAWKPQSTTALVINRGIDNIEKMFAQEIYDDQLQLIIQVHDSLLGQIHESLVHLLPKVRECMLIELPYRRRHTIDVTMKISRKSWHDMEKLAA